MEKVHTDVRVWRVNQRENETLKFSIADKVLHSLLKKEKLFGSFDKYQVQLERTKSTIWSQTSI